MTDRILRRPAVENRVGLSRSTIYELITKGKFPRPILISERAVGWSERVIEDWLSSRPIAGGGHHDS